MPRFQSRLFNWIDQSLPVSLGRKARRALMDVASGELWRHLSWADWQAWWQKIWFTPQLPRLAGYQVVRALLMPARIVTAPLKRKYLQPKYLQSKFLKSREYLGIASSESQPEPLLSGVEQALLPEGATDAISNATSNLIPNAEPAPEPLSEIQFYDLWWAKPKSQLGNFANLDNGTNQLDFPQDLLSEMTSLADLHPDRSLINTELDARSPEPRVPLPPRWLRPLVRFTAWLENTNLKVEREITALTLQVNTALATIPTNAAPTPEAERIAANRAFAVAFAESLQRSRHAANSEINSLNNNQQSESSQLSRNPSNDLSYHFSPNNSDSLIQADSHSQYNIDANSAAPSQWQKIQGLLAAALDYFTGKSARQLQGKTDSSNNGTSNNLNPDHAASQGNLLENSADVTSGILTGEDRTNKKNLVARKSARNLAAKLAAPEPTPELKGNTPPALNSTGELVPNLTQVPIVTDEQFPNSALNFSDDPANPLGNHPDNTSLDTPPQTLAPQDPLARLSELLDAAAAYFFGKKIDESATNVNGLNDSSNDHESLSGNNSPILDDAPTEAPWLSLEDVFGADDGPWPLPGEYDSIALNEMNNLPLPQFANRLAISETTTTQITTDRLTSSLAFDENESWLDAPHSPQNLIQNGSQNPSPVKSYRQRSLNAERPLRAWIETQAQSLGYVYGPMMSVVHWLDSLTVKIENFFVSCGRKIKQMLRWLLKGLK